MQTWSTLGLRAVGSSSTPPPKTQSSMFFAIFILTSLTGCELLKTQACEALTRFRQKPLWRSSRIFRRRRSFSNSAIFSDTKMVISSPNSASGSLLCWCQGKRHHPNTQVEKFFLFLPTPLLLKWSSRQRRTRRTIFPWKICKHKLL